MQRILLISYFFPPCNLTAAERVNSWAKHLNKFGYYPIVISRRWDNKIKNLSDVSLATPEEVLHEKHEHYESYLVPYLPNLKDKIYTKFGNQKLVMPRRALSMIELVMQRYANWFIPFKNIGDFADEFIRKNDDIKKVVISGNPYILFKFGYQMNKKYGTRWIADYRDAWTTSEIDLIARGAIFKYIRNSDVDSEKKWVGSASAITSVSEPILKNLTGLVGINGKWIPNGFEIGEFKDVKNTTPYENFTVTYIGTLYHGQQIELFCEAFIKLINELDVKNVKLFFPGLAFHKDQFERISKIMIGYENYYECTERTEKEQILEIETRSHLLLYPAWKGFNGIIPSKIYEYISSGTHTLVAPSDNGEVEKILLKSGCGTITNTVDETFNFLKHAYDLFQKGIKIKADLSGENAHFFSREHQANRLADLLDEI
jgi:glycosyltransferase involved in cell wall biosynthesis